MRRRPLIERKRLLRSIVPGQPSVMLYAGHIERTGLEFFRLACEQDFEDVVAKAKHGAYGEKWLRSGIAGIRSTRAGGKCLKSAYQRADRRVSLTQGVLACIIGVRLTECGFYLPRSSPFIVFNSTSLAP